jgi:hypothetical protein
VATGQERRRLQGHGGWVEALALSPDGEALATGSADGAVRLWDVGSGKQLAQFLGHRGAVKSLAFVPQGSVLASGSADTTALLWDVAALLRDARPRPAPLTPEQMEGLWSDLAGDDADRAYQAVHALARAGDEAVAFLKARVRPIDARRLSRLIADLDNDDFAVREQAARELAAMGRAAEPTLRKALTGDVSVQVMKSVEALLQKLGQGQFSPERVRGLRAVEVLEAVGTPAAQGVLQGLAKGAAEAELTVDAGAALGRLKKRPDARP